MTDRIALTGLRIRGHHGVLPSERRAGQDFVVDVSLDLDLAPAALSDDVADTVELFHLVNEQDFAATEACQPNMRSRAYAKGGILVPLEQEIIGRWYYDWYRASMNLGESP